MDNEDYREITTEVSGFYPLFETLLKRYNDEITPAVFGVAWRYCQMADGVCKASLRTIAGILNISEATVMRRLENLCNDGYLIDLTPDARNVPHVYADAGLVVMKSNIGVVETVSHRNSTKSVSERKASVSQGNATVSESQLIKDSIKDLNKEKKYKLIRILEGYGPSVFSDFRQWHTWKRRLETDDTIKMEGDEKKIVFSGLSKKFGNFTEAEVWEDKYTKSFANLGLALEFRP